MNCFPCFYSLKRRKSHTKKEHESDDDIEHRRPGDDKDEREQTWNMRPDVKTFTFRELATATKNFSQECLLKEGGFGRVYKGILQSTGQVVAVKQLDKHGLHEGNREFQAEVSMLSQLDHPNLTKLRGYCGDGDQRLLVYDYVSGGSLQDHLHDIKAGQRAMDWKTRMKVAFGVANGLDYLHTKVNPQMVYGDLKASNIMLDDEFFPMLCGLGLHILGQGTGDKIPLSSRIMGTYGYCAPEYSRGGCLTLKSDVYSFGVVLLELITGRKAVDTTRPNDEQHLVAWAQPIFRDPKRYPDMADALLCKRFPERGLNQAVAIASMCLQEEAETRPLISDVMVALSFLSMSTEEGIPTAVPILSFHDKSMSIALSRHDSRAEQDKSSSDESGKDSNHESDSNSEDEYKTMNLESKSSRFGDERMSMDDRNAAQSLKIKYSYSSEEDNERMSSSSSRYDDDDDGLRNMISLVKEDDDQTQSFQSDDQSIGSSEEEDTFSLPESESMGRTASRD